MQKNSSKSLFKANGKIKHKIKYPSDSSSEYYKLSLTIPLVGTVLGELKKRFAGNQTYVFSGFNRIPYVMVASLKSPVKNLERPLQKNLEAFQNVFEDLCLLSLDSYVYYH